MQFENITIQKQTDKESYAGVCEDYHLGMTIIFYVINIADYAKSKWLNYSNRQITKVKFSALSVAGTVLLGMHHSKHQIAVESKGRNRRNQLLDAARNGDTDAMEQLTYDEMNTYTSISSRVIKEDVLSIIDTSFMPCGVECDHYMVIGNIYAVEKLQNIYSKEIVYNLLIEANGLMINVGINEADLQENQRSADGSAVKSGYKCRDNIIYFQEGDFMYLVFDVGGTFVKYAWMSVDGDIQEKGKYPTPTKEEESVPEFVESLGQIYDKYKDQGVEGIALSLPGLIDAENGIIRNGGGIKYLKDAYLAELLGARCDGVKISMENDGKCAALAEV